MVDSVVTEGIKTTRSNHLKFRLVLNRPTVIGLSVVVTLPCIICRLFIIVIIYFW